MKYRLPVAMKHLVVRRATPNARNLVLQLIQKHQSGLTTQELYQETMDYQQKTFATTAPPENPEQNYVVPSMTYLKKVVLPELAEAGKVEKVHLKRRPSSEVDEKLNTGLGTSKKSVTSGIWLWQLKAEQLEQPPKPEKERFGVEVGIGEDWSHLNKRRQRARTEKVERDVQWVRELEKAKREARVHTP